MAGPSVVVRVLGDTKGLSSSFAQTSKDAETASSRVRGAFGSVLGTLNTTGILGPFGDSLARINDTLDSVAGHAKGIGTAMLGVGGTLAGVGVGLAALGSKDQAAHQQLQAAVEATGQSYDDYDKKIEQAVKSQERYGDTANQTQDALRALTQATHDPAQALQLLGTATNIAAAKHEDLTSVATQLGKVYNGNTKLLKEYGIAIDKTTGKTNDGKTAVQALADVTAGQASAAADTFTGKLDAVKTKVEDAAASFGQKYGPAITAAGSALSVAGAAMQAFRSTTEAATVATEVQAAASETAAVAMDTEASAATAADVASAPLIATIGLIVLAVAALIAIAYVLYRNWSTIWGTIKAIVVDAFDWIKTNWPLLLAILTGPIGVAALAIVENWDKIRDGAETLLRDLLGVWKAIANGFIDAINGIIQAWDFLHFTIGGFKLPFPPHTQFPGITISTPHIGTIPHLAQGGLITQTGIVYAHAGEVISPAPGAGGPVMAIENATFSSEVDVELLTKKIEFALNAGIAF